MIDHSQDWRTKLTQAMEGVSEEDHERLKHDGGSWPTCACGRLEDWIRRDHGSRPADHLLAFLGGVFSLRIYLRNYPGAITTLDAIEQRAMELKP